MTILIIGSVLLGAVLGRFFKVLVLVPACMLVFTAVLVRSVYVEEGLLRALLEIAMLIAALQIGYISGVFFHFVPSLPQRQRPRASASSHTATLAAHRHR